MNERTFDQRPVDAETASIGSARSGGPSVSPAAAVLVMLGGALGTAARYGTQSWLPDERWGFPLTTLSINVLGALVLGVLLESLILSGEDTGWLRRARLTVGTGFCGGFTTYSSLAVAAAQTLQHGHALASAAYALGSVIIGAIASFAGIALASRARRGRGH